MAAPSRSTVPNLDKDRHIKYWKRCLKTYLPSQYTSNESNRMYLAYFIISALELLNVLDTSMSAEERAGYINWIYHCQHPLGGFRMWPGTNFDERASQDNAKWDPGHVPGTYFALTTLVTLGDDLTRVQHVRTLQWLRTMQRPDGSFGETMVNGRLEGGRDPRYGYCAAAIRSVLIGLCSGEETAGIEDIDMSSLADCVMAGQSYDGGIADAAFHEPQAGYTFCALGTLDLLGMLDDDDSKARFNREAVVRWLVDRQTDIIDPDADMVDTQVATGTSSEVELLQAPSNLTREFEPDVLQAVRLQAAGMNGRPNKVADTCYAWWVEASLHMLGHADLYYKPGVRSYLLDLTQHPYMGGFCKFPDDRFADVYHSFMGLAALSLASTEAEQRQDGIKQWDATMCISIDARERLRRLCRRV